MQNLFTDSNTKTSDVYRTFPQTYFPTENSYEYAGFWVRLAAYLVDCIIVSAILLAVKLCFGIISFIGPGFSSSVLRSEILFQFSLRDIILYLGRSAYFILLTYYTGTTLGKRLFNLRIIQTKETTTETAGSVSPDFLTCLYRETIGRFLSGFLYIGYIIAGIDHEKRALHDILCDTKVIYAKKIKVFTSELPSSMPSVSSYKPIASPQSVSNTETTVYMKTDNSSAEQSFTPTGSYSYIPVMKQTASEDSAENYAKDPVKDTETADSPSDDPS